MRRRSRNREVFAVFFVIILVLSFIFLYFNFRAENFSQSATIKLYYYDPVTKEIVPVDADVSLKEDNTSNVYTLVNMLKNPPETSLFPLIDSNCNLRMVKISGDLCTVDFTFNKTPVQFYSVESEAATVYGLVNTITGLKGISEVQILIGGEISKYFYHYIEIDKPISHYDSMLPQGENVNLYFPSENLNDLVVERREIFYTDNPMEYGNLVLKELFYGSEYGLPQVVKGDYVDNFSIKSGGIAEVDLNTDILNNSLGSHAAFLFVSSIVDTLTEIPDITAVQITVGGNTIPSLFGTVDISSPLKRFLRDGNSYLVPYYVYNFDGNSFFAPIVTPMDSTTLTNLFNLLKNPTGDYSSMLSKNAKLLSYRVNGDTLEMSIDPGNISGNDLEILKRQIALSFTELPGIRYVKLTAGEESFVLGR